MSDGSQRGPASETVEAEGAYCRAVEAHLCRRNHGHVVRLVGPAFERVRAWAARGIPLKLALQGIDRYIDRAEARGPRRRPVRADFCEADVLDVFDEWRRALGLSTSLLASPDEDAAGQESRGQRSLPRHVDRVAAVLGTIPGRSEVPDGLSARVADLLGELSALAERSRASRGGERQDVLASLERLDVSLMAAARAAVEPAVRDALEVEAREELEAFRPRMSADAYARAHAAATDRLIRRHFRLPTLTFA